eukprot:INCI16717.2.p1 GENE.INCI16717.2~~INCI16717.2.p1  ORF type:complete len:812 (+),score=122.23 INCI16717.2:342-2777(+)
MSSYAPVSWMGSRSGALNVMRRGDVSGSSSNTSTPHSRASDHAISKSLMPVSNMQQFDSQFSSKRHDGWLRLHAVTQEEKSSRQYDPSKAVWERYWFELEDGMLYWFQSDLDSDRWHEFGENVSVGSVPLERIVKISHSSDHTDTFTIVYQPIAIDETSVIYNLRANDRDSRNHWLHSFHHSVAWLVTTMTEKQIRAKSSSQGDNFLTGRSHTNSWHDNLPNAFEQFQGGGGGGGGGDPSQKSFDWDLASHKRDAAESHSLEELSHSMPYVMKERTVSATSFGSYQDVDQGLSRSHGSHGSHESGGSSDLENSSLRIRQAMFSRQLTIPRSASDQRDAQHDDLEALQEDDGLFGEMDMEPASAFEAYGRDDEDGETMFTMSGNLEDSTGDNGIGGTNQSQPPAHSQPRPLRRNGAVHTGDDGLHGTVSATTGPQRRGLLRAIMNGDSASLPASSTVADAAAVSTLYPAAGAGAGASAPTGTPAPASFASRFKSSKGKYVPPGARRRMQGTESGINGEAGKSASMPVPAAEPAPAAIPLPTVTSAPGNSALSGLCALRGKRTKMEDRDVTIDDFGTLSQDKSSGGGATPPLVPSGQERHSFYAVFDGHDGVQAAQFAADHICEYATSSTHFADNPMQAFVEAIRRIDKEFLAIAAAAPGTIYCGSTALTVYVRNGHVYTCTVGDSRCVLCRAGESVELSVVLTPGTPSEKARIEAAGGWVTEEKELVLGRLHHMKLEDPLAQEKLKSKNYLTFVSAFGVVQLLVIGFDLLVVWHGLANHSPWWLFVPCLFVIQSRDSPRQRYFECVACFGRS